MSFTLGDTLSENRHKDTFFVLFTNVSFLPPAIWKVVKSSTNNRLCFLHRPRLTILLKTLAYVKDFDALTLYFEFQCFTSQLLIGDDNHFWGAKITKPPPAKITKPQPG